MLLLQKSFTLHFSDCSPVGVNYNSTPNVRQVGSFNGTVPGSISVAVLRVFSHLMACLRPAVGSSGGGLLCPGLLQCGKAGLIQSD